MTFDQFFLARRASIISMTSRFLPGVTGIDSLIRGPKNNRTVLAHGLDWPVFYVFRRIFVVFFVKGWIGPACLANVLVWATKTQANRQPGQPNLLYILAHQARLDLTTKFDSFNYMHFDIQVICKAGIGQLNTSAHKNAKEALALAPKYSEVTQVLVYSFVDIWSCTCMSNIIRVQRTQEFCYCKM